MKNELIPDDAKMENAPADSGIRLKDLLLLTLQEADVYCVHETADVGFIAASEFARLTETGRKEYAELLNAEVKSIRPGAYGVEIVLGNVAPRLLMDFDEAAARFEQAEYAMGDISR